MVTPNYSVQMISTTPTKHPDLVGVRREMPGSHFHSMVHFVSVHLMDELGDARVVVWQPLQKAGKVVGSRQVSSGEAVSSNLCVQKILSVRLAWCSCL